jgi:alpha/beta hydrolase fold
VGSCLFCNDKASTREDAWPIWLVKRFPLPIAARMFAERGGNRLGDWPQAKPRLTVKDLCRSCNNGWMSRLEGEAKPVVECLLDSDISVIDTLAQSTLAVWAVKTAMVLEALTASQSWFYSAPGQLSIERLNAVYALPGDKGPLFARLSDRFHLVAPDYPGFGHSDWPDPKDFSYTFAHCVLIMNHFTEALGLSRYTLYMQDYGGPVGFRMAVADPERIQALIIQDAVAHNEGLGRRSMR